MGRFAAQNLLPREGGHIQLVPRQVHRKGGRGRVTDGEAVAVVGDPVAVGHAHARGGAVPGEDNVVVLGVDAREINDLAVLSDLGLCVDFQLLDHVSYPARAERLPCQHLDFACAQHRPHGHFHRAGVRRGNDTDFVIGGDVQNFAGGFDRLFQLCLANSGTVRAAQGRISQLIKRESRVLGTGARRKTRIGRTRCRSFDSH